MRTGLILMQQKGYGKDGPLSVMAVSSMRRWNSLSGWDVEALGTGGREVGGTRTWAEGCWDHSTSRHGQQPAEAPGACATLATRQGSLPCPSVGRFYRKGEEGDWKETHVKMKTQTKWEEEGKEERER